MKSIPTVVVWDQVTDADAESENAKSKGVDGEDDEDVWEGMENVGDEEDDEESDEGSKRRGKKSRAK